MHKNNHLLCFLTALFIMSFGLNAQVAIKHYSTVTTGAQQFEKYVPLVKGKRVGIVTNLTGLVNKTSIVDTLLLLGVNIKKIYGPEHGFRGDTEAGEHVNSDKDDKTGLTIVSLYGNNRKPGKEQLAEVDVLIYDIQDLGVRFYTYISTLSYVMEACAENKKELIVLDRPNPNGFYIDGPVLKPEFSSFLGLHTVPIVYGMTTGEYARMVNGEGWLKNKAKCKLTVIALKNYDRSASYSLPAKPSPNIPNQMAVLLYPGLGLFEGSIMSLGRGTLFPFQAVGHPDYPDTSFSFTPLPSALSKEPKHVNRRCFGVDLRKSNYLIKHPKKIELSWLIHANGMMNRTDFLDRNFNAHAGNSVLQEQIKNRVAEIEIRKSWQPDLEKFKKTRKKYLLYNDFKN